MKSRSIVMTVTSACLVIVIAIMGLKAWAAGDINNINNAENTMDTTTTDRIIVKLETSFGDIEVALYNETPTHRDNFIKLVNDGTYDGVLFHRVIKDFMIQTGDPDSKNAAVDSQLGMGGPNYQLPAEIVYPKFFHKKGALAAARQGDEANPERKSSGSQFYIVTGQRFSPYQLNVLQERLSQRAKSGIFQKLAQDNMQQIRDLQAQADSVGLMTLQNSLIAKAEEIYAQNPVKFSDEQVSCYSTMGGAPHLDGQYTVFGEVVKGMDVVDKIQNVATGNLDRPVDDVKIIKATVVR